MISILKKDKIREINEGVGDVIIQGVKIPFKVAGSVIKTVGDTAGWAAKKTGEATYGTAKYLAKEYPKTSVALPVLAGLALLHKSRSKKSDLPQHT